MSLIRWSAESNGVTYVVNGDVIEPDELWETAKAWVGDDVITSDGKRYTVELNDPTSLFWLTQEIILGGAEFDDITVWVLDDQDDPENDLELGDLA